MSGVKGWSTAAGSNVLANTGINFDEGQAPSTLNDSARQLMADVRTEWAQGADIASASTTDLSAATGGYVVITGTVTITAFGTASAGIRRKLRFSGALILTHNATSLILPTGGNITTVAGDTCEVMSEGSGNWRVLWYAGKTVQATNAVFTGTLSATGGISPSFESAEVAIGAGGTTTTAAHGLGAVPRQSWVVIRNKTAELGYSIGDEAYIANGNSFTIYADATNIGIVSVTGNVPGVVRRDTFAFTSITSTNWKYVMRANK